MVKLSSVKFNYTFQMRNYILIHSNELQTINIKQSRFIWHLFDEYNRLNCTTKNILQIKQNTIL